jgi:hypothetical protein
MHVYRNRENEEEIVMLMWHKKGEQRMVETSKQETHTGTSQDHRNELVCMCENTCAHTNFENFHTHSHTFTTFRCKQNSVAVETQIPANIVSPTPYTKKIKQSALGCWT